MKLLLEKFNFTINIEENKHTVIVYSEQRKGADYQRGDLFARHNCQYMLIYFMFLDWRLALIALATFPIGMLCYMGMMKGYEKRYDRVIKAAKAMDAATVEYIGGIEVVKTFNQSSDSYRKYEEAVRENENSKSEWFEKTNPYYAAGIAIAPSSLIGVLPVGSLFYIGGSINASNFISIIFIKKMQKVLQKYLT